MENTDIGSEVCPIQNKSRQTSSICFVIFLMHFSGIII